MWIWMAMCWHEDGYDGSVVACQSYARLCDFSVKPYRSSTYHFLPCTTTCFPQGIWFSKLQTAFMVHTKEEGPWWWFHGPGLKPVIQSGGMGVSGWEWEGAPLRARIYKFDPMLFEVVASPSQSFSWILPRVIPGIVRWKWVCTG